MLRNSSILVAAIKHSLPYTPTQPGHPFLGRQLIASTSWEVKRCSVFVFEVTGLCLTGRQLEISLPNEPYTGWPKRAASLSAHIFKPAPNELICMIFIAS